MLTINDKDATEGIFAAPERKHEHNDCTVTALAVVAELTYGATRILLASAGRRSGHKFGLFKWLSAQATMFCDPTFGEYRAVQISGCEGTLAQFLHKHPTGRFLCSKRGHAFAVIDGTAINACSGMRTQILQAWKFTKE